MSVLKNLQPEKVMHYFQEISSVPRASKNEKEISNWLLNWAKSKNLSVIQDEFLNIIIKKPATKGYESVPTLIIQGHMDMVCEKNSNTSHDFSKEGIKLQVQGDLIKGTGTTLGADNGIAVAFALALLDSELPHPALEVLITSDEEMGMTGALNLNGSLLSGKLMINLDTEEEGEIYVSCAGGARGELEIPVHWDMLPELSPGYLLKIRGLQGGHSGADIHEQRANANKLLGRILKKLGTHIEFSVGHLGGGAKDNAIPREAEASLLVKKDHIEKLKDIIKEMENTFRDEYRVSDSKIQLELEKIVLSKVMDKDSLKKVLDTLVLHPNGINTWSLDISNLVESSLNLGVIVQKENSVLLRSAIRGSVESRKFEIIGQLEALSDLTGAKFIHNSHYPAWKYNPDSKLRDAFVEIYKNITGKTAGIKAIHAGLECGVLSEKIPGVDIISFGPNIRGAHTPEESVSITSIQNTWNFFIKGIESLKNYY